MTNIEIGNPSWSPDGSRIAYESLRGGSTEIYVVNADGTGQTRLTNNNSYDTSPAWSSDGSLVIFASLRGGPNQLYAIDVESRFCLVAGPGLRLCLL